MLRRLSLIAAALVLLAVLALLYRHWNASRPWEAWESFAQRYVQPDGRVVDLTANARSISEGQAYALFFALVANDRPRFDAILQWTHDNLAQGDLGRHLPAWLWGQREDGAWGVIDANPASDADLWIAYTLLQAGSLWETPEYIALGRAVLNLVAQREVAELSLGPMLLPGPYGFNGEDGQWRFNPSYLPEFQFRYLAAADPAGPWAGIWRTFMQLLPSACPAGVVPDWFEWSESDGASPDRLTDGMGSYDAIRVYLWSGMTPQPSLLGETFSGFLRLTRQLGVPPERVDVESGEALGEGPPGFSAAVMPFLYALDEENLLKMQEKRLIEQTIVIRGSHVLGQGGHYYDQVLALFGAGWMSKRYRFDAEGRLKTRWDI